MSLSRRLRLVMLIMTSAIVPLNYCVHDLLFVFTPREILRLCCSTVLVQCKRGRAYSLLFVFAGAL
jgi:hypothetical protein